MTLTRETDTETIATLRAQLDSTLKDRALIMDERDALMAAMQANLLRPNYVRAEAAEARLAERDAENARLRDALSFYADFHESPNDGPWGANSQDFGKIARAMINQPQADALARVRADAVKVKPLVWADSGKGFVHADRYRLAFNGYGWYLCESDAAAGKVTPYGTIEAAKAAAQADYDTRIRAAIGGVE